MEHRKKGAKTIFFLVLLFLGYLGNRWNVPLFFGVDFLFGSIASFIALITLGTIPALVLTALTGIYTLILWGHPYALLTFVGQIAFVSFYYQRARSNLTLATGMFWLLIGTPMTVAVFYFEFHATLDASLLAGLKQALNEIFNAVVASLIIDHSALARLSFLHLKIRRSVFQTVFNVFVAAAIIPSFVILVLDARKSVEQIEYLNRLRLETVSESLAFFSSQWKNLAAKNIFDQIMSAINQDHEYLVTLIDEKGAVIQTNRPGISTGNHLKSLSQDPLVEVLPPNFYLRWPSTRQYTPMVAWGNSYFETITALPGKPGWSIQIEIPLANQEGVVFHQYVRALGLLLVLIVLILLASQWFATLIGNPLARLSSQTTILPGQLSNKRSVTEILSRRNDFIEIRALVENFQAMDQELKHRFTELEQANRMKDEFLATLSHELRTPLNVILGHASLLKQELQESPDGKVPSIESSIDAIARNAAVQNQLVSDLLDISAIITGKIAFHPKIVSLTELGRSVTDGVLLSAEAKGVKLSLELTECPCTVLGDSTRLHQVIWNLLSNAIKFTPRGGHVTLRIFSKEEGNEKVSVIEVADDGKGIEPSFLPHIFERFRQEDSTTTRKFGGLGLGLSIVRHLVELHGGTAQAMSNGKGKGSLFRITLPFLEAAQFTDEGFGISEPRAVSDQSKSSEVEIRLDGLKLLVVDDDTDSRDLMSFVLQKAGALVDTAASTGQALDLLKTRHYHLIVSDIGLPDEDGYTLIRKLRKDESSISRLTPAIALTAYAREEDRRKSFESGFQGYLSKPVDTEKLLLLIREWNPT